MKQIKVAFCIPDMIIGGVESVFISTLEELSKIPELKISVFMQSHLAEPFYQERFNKHPEIKLTTIYPLLPFFENLKKYTKVFPLENLRKIIFSFYKKYKRTMFSFGNTDIFIDYKNASFFKELKNIHKPKITWCHGSFNFFKEAKHINRLDQYNKMVVLTDEFKTEFDNEYPKYANKIIRIYNPINTSDIITRAEIAPTFSGQYFCSVARLGKPKDLRTVIYAFNDFWQKENKPDIKLLLIGDGPKRTELENIANKIPAKSQIVFTGAQTNPFGYMRDSMAHILSSNHEGFGMVLIEAATLGTLNISSNHKNGPKEILQDGKAGLLFEIGDVVSLSHIMSDIYHKRVPIDKMIKNGTSGLNRFATSTIIPQIVKLIKETTKQ